MVRLYLKRRLKEWPDISYDLMEKNNLKGDDIAYLVPHQANLRLLMPQQRGWGWTG